MRISSNSSLLVYNIKGVFFFFFLYYMLAFIANGTEDSEDTEIVCC